MVSSLSPVAATSRLCSRSPGRSRLRQGMASRFASPHRVHQSHLPAAHPIPSVSFSTVAAQRRITTSQFHNYQPTHDLLPREQIWGCEDDDEIQVFSSPSPVAAAGGPRSGRAPSNDGGDGTTSFFFRKGAKVQLSPAGENKNTTCGASAGSRLAFVGEANRLLAAGACIDLFGGTSSPCGAGRGAAARSPCNIVGGGGFFSPGVGVLKREHEHNIRGDCSAGSSPRGPDKHLSGPSSFADRCLSHWRRGLWVLFPISVLLNMVLLLHAMFGSPRVFSWHGKDLHGAHAENDFAGVVNIAPKVDKDRLALGGGRKQVGLAQLAEDRSSGVPVMNQNRRSRKNTDSGVVVQHDEELSRKRHSWRWPLWPVTTRVEEETRAPPAGVEAAASPTSPAKSTSADSTPTKTVTIDAGKGDETKFHLTAQLQQGIGELMLKEETENHGHSSSVAITRPAWAKWGVPRTSFTASEPGFGVGYDYRSRGPAFSLEVFDRSLIESPRAAKQPWRRESQPPTEKIANNFYLSSDYLGDRGCKNWFRDPESKFQDTESLYIASGYHRGHMAAAANQKAAGLKNYYATHSHLNRLPQIPELNRGYWYQVETWVRKLVSASERGGKEKQEGVGSSSNVRTYVASGGFYYHGDRSSTAGPAAAADGGGGGGTPATTEKMIVHFRRNGKRLMWIPTHFFKVVLMEIDEIEPDEKGKTSPSPSLLDEFLAAQDANEKTRSQCFDLHHKYVPQPVGAGTGHQHQVKNFDLHQHTNTKTKFAIAGFVFPHRALNSATPLAHFLVPVNFIEELAGIEFFPDLFNSRERRSQLRAVGLSLHKLPHTGKFEHFGEAATMGLWKNNQDPSSVQKELVKKGDGEGFWFGNEHEVKMENLVRWDRKGGVVVPPKSKAKAKAAAGGANAAAGSWGEYLKSNEQSGRSPLRAAAPLELTHLCKLYPCEFSTT